MSSYTGLYSSSSGGALVNSRAILDLGGQVQYTDENGAEWLKTGNVLTTGLENYPDAIVKTRPLLSTLTYDNIAYSYTNFANAGTSVQAFTFKPDGTRFFLLDNNNDRVLQYDLSTPWDISTQTYSGLFSFSGQENNPERMNFSPDGKILYITGTQRYGLTSFVFNEAWNITSGTLFNSIGVNTNYGNGFTFSNTENAYYGYPRSINFSSDGSMMYLHMASGSFLQIKRPKLRYSAQSQFKVEDIVPFLNTYQMAFSSNGERCYNEWGGVIYEYDMYDGAISSLTYTGVTVNPTELGTIMMYLKPDNTKMYLMQPGNNFNFYQYSLTTEDYIGVPVANNANEYLRIK